MLEYTLKGIYATVLSIDGNYFERESWTPRLGSSELVVKAQLVGLTVVKWEEDRLVGTNSSGVTMERCGNRATVTEFDMHPPSVVADSVLVPGGRI